MSIKLAGLCGIVLCLGGGGALYLEISHFWTTEAIAASEDKPQVVNRLRKDDPLLPARTIDPQARSTDGQNGFGTLEIGGPINARIAIKDANGRLVFELDPLRRMTVISKREPREVPSSKEQGGQIVPKSRVAPVKMPRECDPPASRLDDLGLLQASEECHSRAQNDAAGPGLAGTSGASAAPVNGAVIDELVTATDHATPVRVGPLALGQPGMMAVVSGRICGSQMKDQVADCGRTSLPQHL
jgi:hypothetical protein